MADAFLKGMSDRSSPLPPPKFQFQEAFLDAEKAARNWQASFHIRLSWPKLDCAVRSSKTATGKPA